MRKLCFLAFMALLGLAAGQFNPDSFVGRLVVSAIKHTVQKRSLPEIMTMVSSIAGNVPGLTILGPNGGINLPEILNVILPLFGEVSGGVRCCKVIEVPNAFMDNLMTCIIEPANLMGKNISMRKDQESASMIHPPVTFQELSILMKAELCAMKCALQKGNKLGIDGLPNKELMLESVNMDFKPEAVEIVKKAIESCDKEMRISQRTLEEEMSEEDKCWASNAMVGCLVEKFHEYCPEEFRVGGNQCLANLGSKFWADLPAKIRTIINDFKGNLMKKK